MIGIGVGSVFAYAFPVDPREYVLRKGQVMTSLVSTVA